MNKELDFWRKVSDTLQRDRCCALLFVVESSGSSPGRKGFKMAVSPDGSMFGTIGGGTMEHKLVELVRSLMDQPARFPFRKRQIHQADVGQDRSGMICSGEQTVAFFHLAEAQVPLVTSIVTVTEAGGPAELWLTSSGIGLSGAEVPLTSEWSYCERLTTGPHIAIIGGGHVGAALSRTMDQLGFQVRQFDHREGLNTMEANTFAHERRTIDFGRIEEHVPDDPDLYIVLVSHGYRTDGVALRRLIRHNYKYLGMLGSAEKVKRMFAEMRQEGFTDDELERVHAPIGLPIHSRTPEEIAISIAAEIIQVKNG